VKSNSEGIRVLLSVQCGKCKDRAVIFGAQSIAIQKPNSRQIKNQFMTFLLVITIIVINDSLLIMVGGLLQLMCVVMHKKAGGSTLD
jgi:hypothetical protein